MTLAIDLSGKVALVTGSTRGIGRSIASTLAAAGARVAVVGRDTANAQAVAAELGDAHRGFGCDVSDPSQVAALVAAVEEQLGSCDILVNNAGITRDNLMLRMKDDDWDAVLDANLRSAFVAIRAASRGMMKRRWGRIINITSVVGLMGNAGQANYAAAKAGLIGAARSLAREVGSRGQLRGRHDNSMLGSRGPQAAARVGTCSWEEENGGLSPSRGPAGVRDAWAGGEAAGPGRSSPKVAG